MESADAMVALLADYIEKGTQMLKDTRIIEYLLMCIKRFRRAVYHLTGEMLEDLDRNATKKFSMKLKMIQLPRYVP